MEERILEIPALGRPLQLGTLYDCRNDMFIHGSTLWDPHEQVNDRSTSIQRSTEIDILLSDDIQTKTSALKVGASLKASLLAKLVDVVGSARFLYDKTKSNSQCRQTIHHKTTSRLDSLSMKELGVNNVQNSDVFEQGSATHVVTSVLYGAQAFFVFDRFLKEDEKEKHVKREMHEALKKIIRGRVKGNEREVNETEQEQSEMECTFYSDYDVEQSPTNYKEAAATYNQLSSISKDHAIPLAVWLFPLSKLNSKAAKIKQEIDISSVNQIEEVAESFEKCQVRCTDLTTDIISKEFESFAEKIDLFKKLVLDFSLGFEQKLGQMLPEIRDGTAGEQSLAELLSEIQQSPYNRQGLDVWLKYLEKELSMIQTYMKVFSSITIIDSQEKLDEFLEDPSLEFVVCFSFGFAGPDDEYLSDMASYLREPVPGEFVVKERWFNDKSMLRKTRTIAKQFSAFAGVNRESKATKFGVMAFGDSAKSSTAGSSVFLYKEGDLISKDFTPPGAPGKPEVVETSETRVTLKWDRPKTGLSCVQYYLLKYRDTSSKDNRWVEIKTKDTVLQATISHPKPNTKYECCVAAACSVGVSEPSATSEVYSKVDDSYNGEPIDISASHEEEQIQTQTHSKPTSFYAETARVGWTTDSWVVSEIEEVTACLDQCQDRCSELMSNNICKDFPTFEQKLCLFKKLTLDFKTQIEHKLARILRENGCGTDPEETLKSLQSEIKQSPYNLQQLDVWIKYIEKEIKIVQAHMRDFDSITKVDSQEILDELLGDPSHEYLICFSFGFTGIDDDYLKDMTSYLRAPVPGDFTVKKRWYNNTSAQRKTRIIINQFAEFARVNRTSEATMFAVMAFCDRDTEETQGGSVFLYKEGDLVTNEFIPPGIPGKPVAVETSDETVTLKWQQPKTGFSCIRYYLLMYRDISAKDKGWIELRTGDAETKATIPDLKPNSNYECSVAAACSVGVSESSPTSEVFSTCAISIPDPPTNVRIVGVSETSVAIEWDKPLVQNDILSKYGYKLKCEVVNGDHQGKCLIFEHPQYTCTYTINKLVENTTYRIWVHAVYNKAGDSTHSQPIEFTTATKKQELSKQLVQEPEAHSVEAASFDHDSDLGSVREIDEVKDTLDRFQVRCDDLKSNIICKDFTIFKQKLSTFKKLILDFKSSFERKLAPILPQVRGGRNEELKNTLSEIEQSPFNLGQLDVWVKYLEKEMNIMQTYMKEFESLRIIGSQELLDEHLDDPSVEHIVCFSFGFAGKEDPYLHDMESYLRRPVPGEYIVKERWFNDKSVSRKIRVIAKQFSAFARGNQGCESIIFGVIAFGDINKTGTDRPSVFLYKEGDLVTSEFTPPSTPGKPEVVERSEETITLEWDQPEIGLSFVKNYLVRYRDASSMDNKWVEVKTRGTVTQATIRDLMPNTSYECCVVAACSVGASEQSATSDPISTIDIMVPTPPINVRTVHVTETSVTIEWDRPACKTDKPCIIGYKVKYETTSIGCTGNPNIDEILSNTCTYTIDKLRQNTTFRICVCAVYTKGGDSIYSEPIETTTAQKKEKKVKRICELLTAQSEIFKEGDISKGEPIVFSVPLDKGFSRSQSKYHTYTFGNYVSEKRHLVIMAVGATGAGKSTLINGMVNYILGVEWNDSFRFQIVAEQGENKSAGQAQSQTQLITAYTIHYRDGLSIGCNLTIIDTPGFGDTRGIEKDRVIVDQIREFFSNSQDHQVDHIDAIGFVAQASQARLTHTQRYVFDSILAIFGKNVARNIMLLITFADGQKPPVLDAIKAANIPCAEKMFKFNNSALFASNSAKSDNLTSGFTASGSPDDDNEENFDKMFWKMGTQSMRKFFKALQEAEPQSLTLTKEVLDERKRLEAAVEGLQPQIKMGCSKLETLRKEQQILEQHEREIEANKNFVYDVEVSKSRKIEIFGEYITNCSKCHFTCHYPCYIADDKRKMGCAAMNEGKCTVCPDKCQWDIHFNQAYKFEWYTEKEKKTYRELEEKYKDATGKKLSVKKVIEKHKEEFQAFQECVFGLISESQRCLKRLEEIALRPNPLSTVAYVDLLIESEQREAKPGWEGRVKALNNVRQDAEIMHRIQKANYCPWENYKEQIPGILTREQYEMYRQRALENYDHYGKYKEIQTKAKIKRPWYKFWQ